MTGEGNPVRVLTHLTSGTRDSGQLDSWLQELVSRNGSDLLLVAQASASMRVEGSLVAIGKAPLSHEEIEAAVLPVLAPHCTSRV